MSAQLNRRNWLKSSAVLAGGMLTATGFNQLHARSESLDLLDSSDWRIHEQNLLAPEDLHTLKARLNFNENPFGPSKKALQALVETAWSGNRYGFDEARAFIEEIAEKEGVSKDHIMLGPGSTDLLEKTAIIHCKEGGNMIAADPSYMALVKTSLALGANWRKVPLTKDYQHDLPAMKSGIDANTRLVYICNPNNPTGTTTDSTALKAFCSEVSAQVPVFVDEAYMELLYDDMQSSMIDLVRQGKNVIIARTFSKIHGMAGLRMGYLIAQPDIIRKITTLVNGTMGLCKTSIAAARASYQDDEFLQYSRNKIREGREMVAYKMDGLGHAYIPSQTSFMMFPLSMNGDTFISEMKEKGIGIRVYQFDGKPWGRVSMGTLPELGLFADAFKMVISKSR